MIANFFVEGVRSIALFVSFFQQDPLIIFFKLCAFGIVAILCFSAVATLISCIVFTYKNPKEAAWVVFNGAKSAVVTLVTWGIFAVLIYALFSIGLSNIALVVFVVVFLIFKAIAAFLLFFSAPATVGSNIITGLMISDAIREKDRRY